MKKILAISFAAIVLALLAWYFLFPGSAVPVVNQVQDYLPFGRGKNSQLTTDNGRPTTEDGGPYTETDPAKRPNLFKISAEPIAGAVSFSINGSSTVRYVERATGHIYDVNLVTMEKSPVVKTTIPKVYEAHFKPDGSAVIFRRLMADGETIESTSYALLPPQSTSTGALHRTIATALRSNISELAAGSSAIFYVTKEGTSILSAAYDGSRETTLFTGAFNEWRLSLAGENLIMTTKASASAPGYSYVLNTRTRNLGKLFGPLNGLVVLSNPTFSRLAYAWNDSGAINLSATTLSNGLVSRVFPTTLAEKCAWSRIEEDILYCGTPNKGISASEPDGWYQGRTRFSDRIWLFNVDTGYTGLLADPEKNSGVTIDAEKLFLSPAEDYLIFRNRNDLSLWALKLE